jgi:ABC-type transport system involved in multi-copper enzyme maturation permease subunit
MSALVIARLTFMEASRRRILLAAVILGVIFLAIYGLGFYYITAQMRQESDQVSMIARSEIFNFILMAGLYVVNFLTIMMTVLTSVDTLSGEIASGTIHTLVAKPIRRWEVVAGKWLGYATMLTLYLLLMAGGVIVSVYLLGNYLPPHPLQALGLMWLNALLLLSVSLLGGTMLSTLANGVLVFGLYGIAFIGGWIEQIGTFFTDQAASQTAMNIGILTSLVLPSEALWKRAAHELQSPVVSAFGVSPFTASSYPSIWMIVYSALYVVVIFALTLRQFERRDL